VVGRICSVWGFGTNGRGVDVRKGFRCKCCVLMYVNGKMVHFEIIPGMERRRDKGEWWKGVKGEFKCNIIDYYKNFYK
jgi:hypothetical protein